MDEFTLYVNTSGQHYSSANLINMKENDRIPKGMKEFGNPECGESHRSGEKPQVPRVIMPPRLGERERKRGEEG